jgi:hypothetical protein
MKLLAAPLLCLMVLLGTARAVSDPANCSRTPRRRPGPRPSASSCAASSVTTRALRTALPTWRDIRTIIRQQVVAGQTDPQIIGYMVQRYGTFILLRPPFEGMTTLLWGTPVIALLPGLGIAFAALRQRRRRPSSGPAPLSEAECDRLESLLRL